MARYFRGLLLGVAATALTLAAVAGCGSASPRSPFVPQTSRPAQSAVPSASSSAPASTAGCEQGRWVTLPLTVTHVVSGVPTIVSVRAAQHPGCGYDRIVLDITGSMPTYTIRYASQVIADASGARIALPGQRFLIVTLRPAQAHSSAGVPTISAAVQVLGFPALRSWVLAGDFEGVVTIALGLPGEASVRTGELPGRLYIDVKE